MADSKPGAAPQGTRSDELGLASRAGEFSAYPPIADYGFLSDCEATALVAPSGAIEWMCLPRMDSPSVFGAMLDRRAGSFRFGPEDVEVPADRRYLPGTMVLESSWDCGEGWIIVRDCLVIGPWRHESPERTTHIRPPDFSARVNGHDYMSDNDHASYVGSTFEGGDLGPGESASGTIAFDVPAAHGEIGYTPYESGQLMVLWRFPASGTGV